YELNTLTASSGLDGFSFKSITVRAADQVVLFVPVFVTRFALEDLADGAVKKIIAGFSKVAPAVFRPRLIGVGFVEGEWGAVGVQPGIDARLLARAWKEAR